METQDALQSAAERLTEALDFIEARFDHQMDEFAKNTDQKSKLDDLQKEQAELKSELAEARTQAIKLSSANQDVANRLDHVIDSIKVALNKE